MRRLRRPRGRTAPSCTAAIGGTRVARSAGPIEAITVTTTPIRSATITVRGSIWIPVAGSPKPTASKRACMPRAMPMPASSPMIDARIPMTSASPITLRSTWPRVAPRVRVIPNSRTRWATVIEKVLKMMNAPTKSATPAKASSAGPRKPVISPAMSSLCDCGVLRGRLDLVGVRQGGADAVAELGGRHAVLRLREDDRPRPRARTSSARRRRW